MNEGTSIRQMTIDDWNVFHEMDSEIFPDDMMLEDWFVRRLDRPGFFALELEGALIGQLVLARFGEDEAHLGRIGVAHRHQGKGLGSLLMIYALKWFRDQGGINKVHLYTQEDNYTAQGLYRRFGFEVIGTTWHFFVPLNTLKPLNKYSCDEIHEDEIDPVGEKYEKSIPPAQIRQFLTYGERYRVITLKDSESNVVGVCRFTPGFPGCFPFEIDNTACFDDFLSGLQPYRLPDFDYVRVTFTDNPELAQLCEEREYKLHHKLFKMTLTL